MERIAGRATSCSSSSSVTLTPTSVKCLSVRKLPRLVKEISVSEGEFRGRQGFQFGAVGEVPEADTRDRGFLKS